jgi:hypothetical protein
MAHRTVATRDLGVRISSGNMKLGNVWNVSKDKRTCGPLNKYCIGECYMNTPFYRSLKGLQACYSHNTEIFLGAQRRGQWDRLLFDLHDFFRQHKVELFRVDVDGDIVGPLEVLMWAQLARSNPQSRIVIFTKRLDILQPMVGGAAFEHGVRAVKNLQVKFSIFYNFPKDLQAECKALDLPIAYAGYKNTPRYSKCKFFINRETCSLCQLCFKKNRNVYLPIH